jgi:O-antigen ligase
VNSDQADFNQMKLTRLFVILGFLIFIGGAIQLFIMARGAAGFSNLEGDLPSQVIFIATYFVSFTILLLSKRKISFRVTGNIWFWLLLVWTCLSVFWSGAPQVTIRHVIAILGTTLFSILLVKYFNIREYVHLLAVGLLITIVYSYLVIFLAPSIGVSHIVTTEWQGIFTHKNHLGKAASLSILIFSYLLLSNQKGKWYWLFGLVSGIGLLIGAQSAAAVIITAAVEGAVILLFLIDRAPKVVWTGALAVIVIATMITIPSMDQILDTFGKNETLTGRTQLWDFSVSMAYKKPFAGYGYGAFWLGSEGPSAQIGPDSPMGLDITHAHNGFIELILDLGLVGLLFAFLTYLVAVWKSVRTLVRHAFSFETSIYFILLIWILPFNITEQALLLRNSIFWVLFSSIILYQTVNERKRDEIYR